MEIALSPNFTMNETTPLPFCTPEASLNASLNNETLTSCRPFVHQMSRQMDTLTIIIVLMYALICTIGLLGNGLVIFVIIRYTKMKTVTNLYILNLSIADSLFLVGLPLIITTALIRHWIFGGAMCKLYYILTCINMFTGPFTLAVMSGDRFLAVCYPFSSIRYRTPRYALMAICLIWGISFVVMLPTVLFAQIMPSPYQPGLYSCNLQWPAAHAVAGQKIFLTYSVMLGFVLPVLIISVLYTLLVIRLRTTGPTQSRSAEKRRSHKKVTKLVTLIIAVFIICWLPYWAFQIDLIVMHKQKVASWSIYMFQGFTILSYANSAINPVLYAFTNENFREAFINAFKCAADPILGGGGGARRISEYMNVNNNQRDQQGTNGQTTDNKQELEMTAVVPTSSTPLKDDPED